MIEDTLDDIARLDTMLPAHFKEEGLDWAKIYAASWMDILTLLWREEA